MFGKKEEMKEQKKNSEKNKSIFPVYSTRIPHFSALSYELWAHSSKKREKELIVAYENHSIVIIFCYDYVNSSSYRPSLFSWLQNISSDGLFRLFCDKISPNAPLSNRSIFNFVHLIHSMPISSLWYHRDPFTCWMWTLTIQNCCLSHFFKSKNIKNNKKIYKEEEE